MRIGIFGGTFNPPHIGHLHGSQAAIEQLGLSRLIVVPSSIPPHKELPEGTPPADKRLYMTRATFQDTPNSVVSDVEIAKNEQAYTADTIQIIKSEYTGAELYLLVGTDMYLTVEYWKNSEALLSDVTLAVFSRSKGERIKITEHSRYLKEKYDVSTEIIPNKVIDISSSRLRLMLPNHEGARYIADTTYVYILKNRLYNVKPDWDWLRKNAYLMLDESRIPHVKGCESEAVRLAARWGVEQDAAREAAILHDITKNCSPEENMQILKQHDINIDDMQPGEEKLLHAKTGSVLAKAIFGVSDEIADAIKWHTTGRPGMSTLEKIIYLADYIEPGRDLPGIENLREAAYRDLGEAMRLGLEMSIQDMQERGITPNRVSFDALDDLV